MIFAKSCNPKKWGCTEAGTEVEPAQHFGTVMVSKSKPIPMAAALLATRVGADVALGRIAGGGIIQQGYRWMVRGSLVAGGGPAIFVAGMLPSRMGDGTLYGDDELRRMNSAASRVRFQFRQDADGVMQLYGIHSKASGDDRVPVVQAQWRPKIAALEADLGDGITLIFTPNGGPLITPELTHPEHTDAPMGEILVHPIEEGTDSQIYTQPAADDVTLFDRIITFPVDFGFTSLYVVFSKPLAAGHSYHKPPKELAAYPDALRDKAKGSVQGGGSQRTRWKDRKGRIYEWDRQHGAVEIYDKQGNHLGEYDPDTGEQTKPAKPGRKVEK